MFRDETKAVSAKHAQSTNGSSSSSTPSLESLAHYREKTSMLILEETAFFRGPKLDEERGLIDFFANNFTCTGTVSSRSNLFWVPSTFESLLNNHTARGSVLCVGAMALARLQRCTYYLREAQRMYGTAILSLNNHWKSSGSSNDQAIVLAVLFLAFFEILALFDPSSRESCITHLRGMGAIFQTGDRQFLATEFGAKMLLQSRSQIIMYALQSKTPVVGFWASGKLPMHHMIPAPLKSSDDLDYLLIRLAELQAHAQSRTVSATAMDSMEILRRDLHQWSQNVPPSWSFSRQKSKLTAQSWWDARSDVYPTTLVANVWNKYRAAQVILLDLLAETNSRLTSNTSRGPGTNPITTPEIQQLVTDICATVPIYYRPSTFISHSRRQHEGEDKPLLGTTYWLLWVLKVVGCMREAPVELTTWVQRCLLRIFECTGIIVAQRAAAGLEMRLSSLGTRTNA